MDYYNEIDDYAATWIENLILDGLIPDGRVDRRSIVEVTAADLSGYRQCHFFAGIAGWPLALKLAGWPEGRRVWTGSCPCQPFSQAGRGEAQADDRHLWPHLFRLTRACRPDVLMGEQVAAAVGKDWLDGVFADLEGIDYACGAVVVPACAVNAPHRRDRLWFVADASGTGLEERTGDSGVSGEALRAPKGENAADASERNTWGGGQVVGHDGKARRVEPGLRLLAHGVPARVGLLRAYGNAIVPQVAAEVISAYLECRP